MKAVKCPQLLSPLIAALTLAACAGKPAKPPTAPAKPAPAATPAPAARLQPPLPSYRYARRSYKDRILSLALHEWAFFGNQRVIYDDEGESIPRVGQWEDDDYRHAERVNMYWRSAHSPGLNGFDCQQPWSAAFISWVMEAAGVSDEWFPPAGAHWVYLARFLNGARYGDSVFVPRTIHEYSPQAGDLICATREPVVSPYISEPPPAYLLENTKLHCDIVVEKRGQTLHAIGGNVRNSVSRSELTLSPDGFLQPTPTRQWFLVVENRLD
jgi:hypothetical protein